MKFSTVDLEVKKIDSSIHLKYGGYDQKNLPQYSWAEMRVVVEDVRTAMASAIRRTLLDELMGCALMALDPMTCITKSAHYDPYTIDAKLANNISLIPIAYDVDPDIVDNARFTLQVENATPNINFITSWDIFETTGRVKRPSDLFNKFVLGVIHPGYVVEVKDIRLTRGVGSKNARVVSHNFGAWYQTTRTASNIPLDVELYTDDQIRKRDQPIQFTSGFKESVFQDNSKVHGIFCTLPVVRDEPHAVKLAKMLLSDTCDNIIRRLKAIHDSLTGEQHDINVNFMEKESRLKLKYETVTITSLIVRTAADLFPDISINDIPLNNFEVVIQLTCTSAKPKDVFVASTKETMRIFEKLKDSISSVKVSTNTTDKTEVISTDINTAIEKFKFNQKPKAKPKKIVLRKK